MLLCLCAGAFFLVGEASPHASGGLKGITAINYDTYFEIGLAGSCSIDVNGWNTALRFIANQSVRLKFVVAEEYRAHLQELSARASSLAENALQSDELGKTFEVLQSYGQMPHLFINLTLIEMGTGCAGTVDGELSARVASTGTNRPEVVILHTKEAIYGPEVIVWHYGKVLRGTQQGFSAQVIRSGEDMFKKLVNEWTEAQ
jgi:hypothetical protein